MITYIESYQNKNIKNIKKLTHKKYQIKNKMFLIEGWHLIKEAIKFKYNDILQIYTIEDYWNKLNNIIKNESHFFLKDKIKLISNRVAEYLKETKNSQKIFAIMKLNFIDFPSSLDGAWLLLDSIQDPGNLGTMIRTADAAGFHGVVLGKGCVNEYNPKVIRSMQGSQFHIDIFHENLTNLISIFQKNNVPVYGSDLNLNSVNYRDIHPQDNFALIIGNEGHGVDRSLLNKTDFNLYIPIKGQAESLNASVAAAILMFWILR